MSFKIADLMRDREWFAQVEDLASTNGTVVNGERIAERQLVDGDRIEIGNAVIRFEAS